MTQPIERFEEMAMRLWMKIHRPHAPLTDGQKIGVMREYLAKVVSEAEEEVKRVWVERCAKELDEYRRQCEQTATKLSEATDETNERMYWRADGASDALEALADRLRSLERK